jgi:hypothetical protein
MPTRAALLRPLPIVLGVLLVGVVVAVWARNRDILRDVYDYSTVITAAGKVEAGLKPYTGVRSPMQSAVYLFHYGTERVFGRHYLGLTFGGLVQALLGGVLLWVAVRRCGEDVTALLVVAAVLLAGASQHVVFFYNPIGLLALAVVVWGLAREPGLRPWSSWRSVVVLAALAVGGINKINFHGAALAMGGALVWAAWVRGRLTGRQFSVTAGLMFLAGVVVPLGFELAWTGAGLRLWWENVVLLPTARHVGAGLLLDTALYRGAINDFYPFFLFRPLSGLGALLILGVGVWLGWQAWRERLSWADTGSRLVLVVLGLVLAGLLVITNHETVMLTSLGYPVVAVALVLAYRRDHVGADRVVARVVVGATLVWTLSGGYAAWHGSRVLYDHNPPPRSAYVRVEETTGPLAYFRGVRFLPDQRQAWDAVVARLEALQDEDGRLRGVLFGPAMEWLERAYPECIVPLAPIWYHAGTSLRGEDVEYFPTLLDGGRSRLLTHRFWQEWPHAIERWLAAHYVVEAVSSRDVMYHPRRRGRPPADRPGEQRVSMGEFRDQTGGNVMLRATGASANLALHAAPDGAIFGATEDSQWHLPQGPFALRGRAVGRWTGEGGGTRRLTLRIMADDPENGEMIWKQPVRLTAAQAHQEFEFAVFPAGRPLWLQTVYEDESVGEVLAGWREVRITHAGPFGPRPALPYRRELVPLLSPSSRDEPGLIRWFGRPGSSGPPRVQVPAEHWRRHAEPVGRLQVALRFVVNQADPGDPVVVSLAWYRAGRFEIMTQRMIDLRQETEVSLEGYPPEPVGWLGVLTRPAGGAGAGHRWELLEWTVQ